MVDRSDLLLPRHAGSGLTQSARLSRRDALMVGGAALAGLAMAPWPAAAVTVDITQGNVQPMPIAIPDFLGGAARRQRNRAGRLADHRRQSQAQRSVRADRSGRISRKDRQRRRGAAVSRLAHHQRAGAGRPAGSRASPTDGSRPNSGCGMSLAGQQLAGQQYFTTPDNWRRIAHIISDAIYERLTGEKGYFDSRVVFVDETGPAERRIKRLAIMDQDGANVRYLTRGDELVLTPRFSPSTQEITYMAYGAGRSARLSAQHRDRPARDRRQLSGHELRAAVLARRSARGDELAGRQQRQHLRDGLALQGDDALDRHARDRYRAVLLTRWRETVFRVRPRRPSADLRHGRVRRSGAAHQLWRRLLFDPGLVAARRLHRLHPAGSRASSPSA